MQLKPILGYLNSHRWLFVCLALLCLLGSALLSVVPWVRGLDQIVVARMSEHHWSLPARVYARPLELYSGQSLSSEAIQRELSWLGYTRSNQRLPGHFDSSESTEAPKTLRIFTRGFNFSDGSEPARDITLSFEAERINSIQTDGDADFLRLEPLEIGSIHPTRHIDRLLVTLDDLPTGFLEALVAVEDRRFYQHYGVSIKGIIRAIWINLKTRSKRQGASTLTQQLVKNLFLTSEKTYSRKFNEIVMAMLLEYRYDKNTILETFINEVFIAQDGNRAIHGFGLASEYFYGRPLAELLPHDFALLIGMLKAPSNYNPVRHPESALNRRNLILRLMNEQQYLPDDELELATKFPLGVTTHRKTGGNPAYLDAVKRQLNAEYASSDLEQEGLRVFSNYDPLLQYEAEQSVETTLASISKRMDNLSDPNAKDNTPLEAALVLTEPNTGAVKAIVGGRNPRYAGFNRALDAERAVGSILKPAIFLSAWEQHEHYTLATLINDTAITLPQQDGSLWEPQNYYGEENGQVTTLEALSRSLNLASVNLGLELGVDSVIETLERLGLEKTMPEIPSIMLGARGLTAMDIAQIYQTIAADGFSTPLRTISEVVDSQGITLSQYSVAPHRKFDAKSIYLVKYALATAMYSGTGRSTRQDLPEGFHVAGKTGTSDDNRDSWFAGFSGDYLATVWIGHDNNNPTPLTGSSGGLAVWKNLFRRISKEPLNLNPPLGVNFHTVDPTSGFKVPERCETGLSLPFVEDSEPEAKNRCPTDSSIGHWFRSLLR